MTPETVDAPRYVKAAVAARLLGGISMDTLRALARSGVIDEPVRLTARTHLYSLENINHVLAQRRSV